MAVATLVLVSILTAQPPVDPASTATSGRKLSPRITELIAASLPKFTPKTPAKETENEEATAGDELKDDVLHLKKVVVNTPRPSDLTPDDMLSAKGRMDGALKKFAGLLLGPFASLNRAIAAEMDTEDREARKSTAILDIAKGATRGDDSAVNAS